MQLRELRGTIPLVIPVPYGAAGITGGGALQVPFAAKIVSAVWTAGAAITGAATNNFVLSFFNRGSAGAGTVAWATAITYASGTNATKGAANALTLSSTASDLLIAANDNLTAEITTNGTGLICPGGGVTVYVRWN